MPYAQELSAAGFPQLAAQQGDDATALSLEAKAEAILTRMEAEGRENPNAQEAPVVNAYLAKLESTPKPSSNSVKKENLHEFLQKGPSGKNTDFGNELGVIAPMGTEVLQTYLTRKFGADNVIFDKNGIIYRKNLEDKWKTLPGSSTVGGNIAGALKPMGGMAAGEGVGGLVGSLGGPVGAGIGALAGAGIGAYMGSKEASSDARKVLQKYFSPDEISNFNKEREGTARTEGVVGAATGSLLPVARGIKRLAKGEPLMKAIRQETAHPAQSATNYLRVEGNTGNEIEGAKGALEAQTIMDKMLSETAGYQPGQAGAIARKAVQNAHQELQSDINQAFNVADKSVQKAVTKGEGIGFIDGRKFYQKLSKALKDRTSQSFTDEADGVLSGVEAAMNGTRNKVISGELKGGAKPAVQAQFGLFGKAMEPSSILGAKGEQVLAEKSVPMLEFNPAKMTAADARALYNQLGDTLEQIGKGDIRGHGKLKKVITNAKNEVGRLLGLDDALAKGESAFGEEKLLNGTLTPTPGASKDLGLYKQAYKTTKAKYSDLHSDVIEKIGATDPTITDTLVEKNLFGLGDPTKSKQVRNIVSKYSTPEEVAIFEQGTKDKLYRSLPRTKTAQIDLEKVSPKAEEMASIRTPDEMSAYVESGERPVFNPVKQALKQTKTGEAVPEQFDFGSVANKVNRSSLDQPYTSLLSDSSDAMLQADLARGAGAQARGGQATSGHDFIKTISSLLRGVPGGPAVSNVLSGTVNPLQRAGADALEFSKIASPALKLIGATGTGMNQSSSVDPSQYVNESDPYLDENLVKLKEKVIQEQLAKDRSGSLWR